MAALPNGANGNHWAIVNIGNDVLILEDPGGDFEDVHLRFDASLKEDLLKNLARIEDSDRMSPEQKQQAGFWYGYFYGFLYHRMGD